MTTINIDIVLFERTRRREISYSHADG